MPEAIGERQRIIKQQFPKSAATVAGKLVEVVKVSDNNRPLTRRIRSSK